MNSWPIVGHRWAVQQLRHALHSPSKEAGLFMLASTRLLCHCLYFCW